MKQGGKLLTFVAVLWLLAAGPAWWLAGTDGMLGLSIAAVACLIPGLVVFLIVPLLQTTDAAIYSVGAATVLRLFFVGLVVIVVRDVRPDLRMREFHLWILTFYLGTLLFETLMLVKSAPVSTSNNVDSPSVPESSTESTGIQG